MGVWRTVHTAAGVFEFAFFGSAEDVEALFREAVAVFNAEFFTLVWVVIRRR